MERATSNKLSTAVVLHVILPFVVLEVRAGEGGGRRQPLLLARSSHGDVSEIGLTTTTDDNQPTSQSSESFFHADSTVAPSSVEEGKLPSSERRDELGTPLFTLRRGDVPELPPSTSSTGRHYGGGPPLRQTLSSSSSRSQLSDTGGSHTATDTRSALDNDSSLQPTPPQNDGVGGVIQAISSDPNHGSPASLKGPTRGSDEALLSPLADFDSTSDTGTCVIDVKPADSTVVQWLTPSPPGTPCEVQIAIASPQTPHAVQVLDSTTSQTSGNPEEVTLMQVTNLPESSDNQGLSSSSRGFREQHLTLRERHDITYGGQGSYVLDRKRLIPWIPFGVGTLLVLLTLVSHTFLPSDSAMWIFLLLGITYATYGTFCGLACRYWPRDTVRVGGNRF